MRIALIAAIVATTAVPTVTLAKDKHHDKGNKASYSQACPPGLAKKSPACVPPGLAKKAERHDGDHDRADRDGHDRDRWTRHDYRVGDRVVDFNDLVLIRDPGRYGLDPYGTYYKAGDQVIKVDSQTSQIMAMVGLVSAILGS